MSRAAVKQLVRCGRVCYPCNHREFSQEKHYEGLKSAMAELGGVVPKWSPPVSEIMAFNAAPMDTLTENQLTVLARAHFEAHPTDIPIDKARACVLWERAMQKGSPEASYCYAMCLVKGMGTEKDVQAGKNLLVAMSDTNPYAPADLALAKLLRTGDKSIGLESNPELAFSHLAFAATRGLVEAQFSVANAYWAGDGCEKSDVTAIYWFKAAAMGGNRDAKFVLGTVYSKGLGGTDEEEDAQTQGWEFYCQAADAGCVRSMFNVGVEHLQDASTLVEKNVATAAHWFEKSAALGFLPAITNLGNMYRDGLVGRAEKGGGKDMATAREWYQKGADAGDETCKELLKQT